MTVEAAAADALLAELLALRSRVGALARANVHAAELMAELREARELEDLLRRKNEEIAQAQAVERARSIVLENIARNETMDSVADSLAHFAFSQLAQPVALFLNQGRALRLRAQRGLEPAFAHWLSNWEIELDSPIGESWTKARTIESSLGGSRGSFEERCRGAGFGSCFCQPFINSSRAVQGVTVLFRREAVEAGRREKDALSSVGVLAALGLEQRGLYEQLSYQAHYDALTTLPNRTHFSQVLTRALEEARISGTSLAVLWVDLDRFKQINDTLGHRAGDNVLKQAANRLRQSVRADDTVARIGGDEFILVLRRVSGLEAATAVARAILATFETPLSVNDHELVINVSVGISLYPDHGSDSEALSRNADIAMYNAKHSGRNRMSVFTADSDQRIRDRFQLEVNLRRALEQREFELHFQPQARITAGLPVSGVEALLRWNSAALGRVTPDRFIPVAEASGLIVPIGRWVLLEACRVAAAWNRAGHPLRMAVNVSSQQFTRPDFVETIDEALRTTGLHPCLLELELTESAILSDSGQCIRNMEYLRAMGVALAVDDFGTGYSSLSYLHNLPVNRLKVDRSFIKELNSSASSLRLVEAVVQLAKALKLEVVAEGVETREQLDVLEGMGCSYVQGYFVRAPLPLAELERFLGFAGPAAV